MLQGNCVEQCNTARPVDFRELLLPQGWKSSGKLESVDKGWGKGNFYRAVASVFKKKKKKRQSASIDIWHRKRD